MKHKRLEYIDKKLYWDGKLHRNDLIDYFKISAALATKDLKEYANTYPENVQYLHREGRYWVKTKSFKPQLYSPRRFKNAVEAYQAIDKNNAPAYPYPQMQLYPVMVNPKTAEIDDDKAKNTIRHWWIESASWIVEKEYWRHDVDLDCGAEDPDDAVILFAEKLYDKYTPVEVKNPSIKKIQDRLKKIRNNEEKL